MINTFFINWLYLTYYIYLFISKFHYFFRKNFKTFLTTMFCSGNVP